MLNERWKMRGSCESWGATEVFRTARTNNLDARSALRLSPLTRPEPKDQPPVSQPVTLRHKVSHSVTIVTPARLLSIDSDL
jgi:hypothetical protein